LGVCFSVYGWMSCMTGVRVGVGLGLEFAEGLGGLGEGVGEDLVPVHVRAACAQFPGALFAQGLCCY